jgi:hypothetical protein
MINWEEFYDPNIPIWVELNDLYKEDLDKLLEDYYLYY